MIDEYSRLKEYDSPGCITGVPLVLATYMIGARRMAEASKFQGWV